MWRYFDRCRDTDDFGWLGIEAAGFDTVYQADHDATVDRILLSAVLHAPRMLRPQSIINVLDTNDGETVNGNRESLYRIPLSTKDGGRYGVISDDTLVTEVKFDNGRAAGLEYLRSKRAYWADRDDTKLDRRPLPRRFAVGEERIS